MGVLRSIVKSADNSSQVEEEVKEALAMLVELAQEKAVSAEEKIKLDLQTGKTTDDLSVPITKVIQSKTEYRALTSTSSSDLVESISSSISVKIQQLSAVAAVKVSGVLIHFAMFVGTLSAFKVLLNQIKGVSVYYSFMGILKNQHIFIVIFYALFQLVGLAVSLKIYSITAINAV